MRLETYCLFKGSVQFSTEGSSLGYFRYDFIFIILGKLVLCKLYSTESTQGDIYGSKNPTYQFKKFLLSCI